MTDSKVVPTELQMDDRFRPMQDAWNKGMAEHESLAMLWPKLVAAAPADWSRLPETDCDLHGPLPSVDGRCRECQRHV